MDTAPSFGVRARFWFNEGDKAICIACERRCAIPLNSVGICRNYKNIENTLYSFGYGKVSAIESRPIEVKPLFHYWPNSTATTFSFWGCNFYCPWCQNYYLSFRPPTEDDRVVMPEELLRMAIAFGDEGFSASFNEPTVCVEYLLDLAELAKEKEMYFVAVTNGYQTISVLDKLLELGVDGWSIDIKGCPKMKRALPSIDHSIVYRNAKHILDRGGHVEMVYLVITNTNDFDECVEWVIDMHVSRLGYGVPLHINRYYPAHRWCEPPTPMEKLLGIATKAKREGIEYVYVGNVGSPELESTRCPRCGKMLILRSSYRVREFNLIREGDVYKCPRCGRIVPIRGRYICSKKFMFF